jgi:Ser/Thr protein kinase RdoA (MazF antagonist)
MRAYDRVNQGDFALEKQDVTGALAHYDAGMKILPDNAEIKFWVGVTLASLDRVDESLPLFRAAFRDDPAWIELTRRLTKPGLIPNTDKGRAAVERILREAK